MMTSVLEVEPPVAEAPVEEIEAGQRLVLSGVQWPDYEKIGEALRDRSGLRLTYDRGSLEIVTITPKHEKLRYRLARFIDILAEETDTDIDPSGSATFKRPDIERGIEPDECYWTVHAEMTRELEEWDPTAYPPPDLVVEVDVSNPAVDRMDIYASLGVPEIWRWKRGEIQVLLLSPEGKYEPTQGSPAFGGFPVEQIAPFLKPAKGMRYLDEVKAFRAWVREQIENG
jgi:Uma2 family endonuclease